MKNKFGCILVVFLMFTLAVCGINFGFNAELAKAETATVLNYVSLGDSIPEGYALEGYSNKDVNGFVLKSYPQMFANKEWDFYTSVSAKNFANAGDTSTDLLCKLTGLDESGNTLTGTDLIISQNIQTYVQGANVITICIGANDILSATSEVMDLVSFVLGMSTTLIDNLNEGVESFNKNFPKILARLNELNANAKILFSNVYNPYKELIDTSKSLTISYGTTNFPLSSAKLKEIGKITEIFLNANSEYNNESIISKVSNGINNIIEEGIKNNSNYKLVDVKNSFDVYYNDNSKYDIVNCSILEKDTITYNELVDAEGISVIDPHPTQAGHQLIFDTLNLTFESKLALLKLNYGNGTYNNLSESILIVNKGSQINKTSLPIPKSNESQQLFGGWYISDNIRWNFAQDVITQNVILTAKYQSLSCNQTNLLNQSLRDVRAVEFSIDVDEPLQWYVNSVLVQNETANTYTFLPEQVGEYDIYCKLNNVESRHFTVTINYWTPNQINIFTSKVTNGNYYTFSIEDSLGVDATKCIWYKQYGDNGENLEQIGSGISLSVELAEDCKIYVVYEGNINIVSNKLEINPTITVSNMVYIIIGVATAIVAFVIVLVILSKRKYNGYY